MGPRRNNIEDECLEVVVYHWYRPYHKIGGIFIFIWGVMNLTLWSPVLIPLVRWEFSLFKSIFALCAFFFLIPAPAYWMLLYFTNKTTVEFKKVTMIVSNGPLPSTRSNHYLSLDDIKYIVIEEHCLFADLETEWHVKAFMRNGKSKYIFMHINELNKAMSIRSLLNRRLTENSRTKIVNDPLLEKRLSGSCQSRNECGSESVKLK